MADRKLGFSILQIHGGQSVDKTTGSRAVPIYQTTSYCFDSVQHGADLFALKTSGHIYSRISNPTVAVFEERMALLEGGEELWHFLLEWELLMPLYLIFYRLEMK